MRDLLLTAITESSWPVDDKVGDQLPKNYTSKRTRISQDSGVTTGQKREAEDILATAQLRKRRKVK
ncbi:hypothetical protein A0H81_06294 [Grifola frondosa]|uniref:Uncharacterized protein n=1 Tax=Grifola frondosa TaxID=5627 RepID=A0A1C7M9C0_GRIFR|nr:hypothetical protein A0H81_06294 [Grifola frondosa]